MGRYSTVKKTRIEELDDEILELTVKQIGEHDIRVFETLHVRIMDKQRERRELIHPTMTNRASKNWIVDCPECNIFEFTGVEPHSCPLCGTPGPEVIPA